MPEPRRTRSDLHTVEALAAEAVEPLRAAVLRDGGFFGPDSRSVLLMFIGRAFEEGRGEAAYWRARALQEGERAEALDRRRKETERELRACRPTPPSFPPPLPRTDVDPDATPVFLPRPDVTRPRR